MGSTMPHTDEKALLWRNGMAERVGRSVRELRKERGLSVAQLSQRTAESGFPIHRIAISKIETNYRAGKLDLAELIVLAFCLGVRPVHLIYPNSPEPVEVRPGIVASTGEALDLFSGGGMSAQAKKEAAQALSNTRELLAVLEDQLRAAT